MKVPYTINKRILKLYRSPANVFKSSNQIIAEDFEEWDQNLPKTLKEQCIQTIACNWLSESPYFMESLVFSSTFVQGNSGINRSPLITGTLTNRLTIGFNGSHNS